MPARPSTSVRLPTPSVSDVDVKSLDCARIKSWLYGDLDSDIMARNMNGKIEILSHRRFGAYTTSLADSTFNKSNNWLEMVDG